MVLSIEEDTLCELDMIELESVDELVRLDDNDRLVVELVDATELFWLEEAEELELVGETVVESWEEVEESVREDDVAEDWSVEDPEELDIWDEPEVLGSRLLDICELLILEVCGVPELELDERLCDEVVVKNCDELTELKFWDELIKLELGVELDALESWDELVGPVVCDELVEPEMSVELRLLETWDELTGLEVWDEVVEPELSVEPVLLEICDELTEF
ncbi:hypothetical protein G7Y89_g5320 [Cudoniella acicularis]|uniref:Uncharacterized protein n=1 Tax=Cudoniella acicularis TaxID=354080 RepID=A0A8H4W440_9HELO|nr:hypothetical protein G7Y89_g5320 [Cudoniella acicularis]